MKERISYIIAWVGIIVISIVLLLLTNGCTKKVYVPIEKTVTITQRDTIVKVRIEHEYKVDTVGRDTTSVLETKYAVSTAKYDSKKGKLDHILENKSTDSIPIKIIVKEKVVKEPQPYSVEVPVEVKVPTRMPLRWYEKLFIGLGVGFIGVVCGFLYKKIKK